MMSTSLPLLIMLSSQQFLASMESWDHWGAGHMIITVVGSTLKRDLPDIGGTVIIAKGRWLGLGPIAMKDWTAIEDGDIEYQNMFVTVIFSNAMETTVL